MLTFLVAAAIIYLPARVYLTISPMSSEIIKHIFDSPVPKHFLATIINFNGTIFSGFNPFISLLDRERN